ncbi:CvpA family protein [Kiritimatiella glycovorans]|uniref:CvpA family protein n=1 Tax=Kiritimatiella glycovorans TaxID=1307763 RepID=UPI001364BC31|nr:CvpA family protein [Kiritimatiella glycovorans]
MKPWIFDAAAVLILLIFIVRGLRLGGLAALLRFGAPVAGIAAALCFAGPVAAAIHDRAGFAAWWVPVVTSLALFMVVLVVFGAASNSLRPQSGAKKRGRGSSIRFLNRLLGAAAGLVVGALFVVAVFWMTDAFRGALQAGEWPAFHRSRARAWSSEGVRRGVYAAVRPRVGRERMAVGVAGLLSEPGRTCETWRRLWRDEDVQRLIQSERFARDLFSGRSARIATNPELHALLRNEEAVADLEALGILPGRMASPLHRQALAAALAQRGEALRSELDSKGYESFRMRWARWLDGEIGFTKIAVDPRFWKLTRIFFNGG